jgi:hypothetical protein
MLQLLGMVAMFFLIGGAVGTALFFSGLLDNRTHSPPRPRRGDLSTGPGQLV